MSGVLWLLAIQNEAREALQALSDKLRDIETLSARFTQVRKTALLSDPLTSSGTLYYRREPALLVFKIDKPRTTEIHLDRASYQAYRPDEKRLERVAFKGSESASRLLMIFHPDVPEIEKTFALRGQKKEIIMEPLDEKARRAMPRLTLSLSDGELTSFAYVDAEGDEVRFELSELALNPKLPAETFQLKLPEGTRILKHDAK